ncbi:hypothetical protein DFH06DRAFT_1220266 [Mycena polygramma]|nr:hypothetical protein DFH06DRAFT_1220266 [Mycena polygramma]
MLPIIQTQLLRSSNAFLDVHWSASTEAGRPLDTHSRDAILAECSRLCSLNLDAGYDASFDWLQPVTGRLRSLRKFDLVSLCQVEFPEIFAGASSLREVYASGRIFTHYSPTIAVPWAQITHFRGLYDTETQRTILAAASNLLECKVYFDDGRGAHSAIAMPCLRRLCVDDAGCLFHLTAPLLEVLFTEYTPGMVEALHFIQRSSCLLKTLVSIECTISSDLILVLRELPSLTYLFIDDSQSSNKNVAALLEAMTITRSSRDVSPTLTSMVFGLGQHFPSDIFFTMARSRFQLNLRRLRLFNAMSGSSPDWLSFQLRMEKLRDEGFDAATLDHYEARMLKERVAAFDTVWRSPICQRDGV